MTVELRDYQREALHAIVGAEKRGVSKQLIVLPTGTGKTVIFTHLGEVRADSYPMLVLAHREELLDQARDKFATANPDLKVGKEQAEHAADLDCDVVVASVATVGRSNSARVQKWGPEHFSTMVVDEAHHAAAESYRRVLDYFRPALVLGVTATPQRSDNVRLSDVFEEVVFFKTTLEMIQKGWLCPLKGYRIDTGTDISGVGVRAGDYIESELVQAIDTPERNQLVVRTYNDLAAGRPTLVFAAGIQHAQDLTDAFRSARISVDCILGETDSGIRADVFEKLRSGRTSVVVNVGVLTEGFDEPSVSCIILARPTKSNLLYTQIIGRGTRLHAEKLDTIVIDLADVTKGKKPIGLPSLLGLPNDFDLGGRDLLEAYEAVEEILTKSPEATARIHSFADIEAEYKLIDIFRPPKPSATVIEFSTYIWAETADDQFVVNITSGVRFYIRGGTLGDYNCYCRVQGVESLIYSNPDLREAFAYTDGYIQRNYSDQAKLIEINAAWRQGDPTEKQVKYLRRLGVPITTDLTKGEASLIISKHIEENPRSFAQQKAINYSKRKKISGGW